MTLSVTNTFASGTNIVASDMNTNFNEVEAYVNGTGGNAGLMPLNGGTLSGALVVNSDLTVDSTTFHVDAGNDVVGVGTATPSSSYKLDVNGAARFVGAITASGGVTGDVTGDVTGAILTAAQTNITSVGDLSALTVTGIATLGGITLDSVAIATIVDSTETFPNNDTSLVTSATVQTKIEDYGYSTTTITVSPSATAPTDPTSGDLWIVT